MWKIRFKKTIYMFTHKISRYGGIVWRIWRAPNHHGHRFTLARSCVYLDVNYEYLGIRKLYRAPLWRCNSKICINPPIERFYVRKKTIGWKQGEYDDWGTLKSTKLWPPITWFLMVKLQRTYINHWYPVIRRAECLKSVDFHLNLPYTVYNPKFRW